MKIPQIRYKYTLLYVAIALGASVPAYAWKSPVMNFSIDDLQRDFRGNTYGSAGVVSVKSTICGIPPSPACPAGVSPLVDKDGTVLHPIDSEFGFNVIDFLGAQEKHINGDYKEGFAGNIVRDGQTVGIRVSNASTETYKVPAGLGTWCQGLGGTSVKCSTEHYTVMEHVLSCFETIPYKFADPVTGTQEIKAFPDQSASYDCANAQLDDVVNIITGGVEGMQLTDATPGAQIDANDNTTILDDIAASTDYSITLKDDGKPLYRWGTLIKRPNDIRMYKRITLPYLWKQPGQVFAVNKAKLVIKHVVTNNPNDQIRPEDLENEAAIGRLPSYEVDSSNPAGDVWKSLKTCYEGDGDLIDVDEGAGDPTLIPAGTVFKNEPFAQPADPVDPLAPLPFSEDLKEGFTNGWYTTVDREPFEWSYRKPNTAGNVFEFVSSPVPNASLGTLVSGPRWRLKPNKFGQDLPGLEIPISECSPPPYANDNIKYAVGTPVTTVINLLDWDEVAEGGPSPLATSAGWVDVTQNGFVEVAKVINGVKISSNGVPMTEDFDLAVYVKGDKKPTSVYSVQLFLNEDPTAADLEPYVDPLDTGGSGGEVLPNNDDGFGPVTPDIDIIQGL